MVFAAKSLPLFKILLPKINFRALCISQKSWFSYLVQKSDNLASYVLLNFEFSNLNFPNFFRQKLTPCTQKKLRNTQKKLRKPLRKLLLLFILWMTYSENENKVTFNMHMFKVGNFDKSLNLFHGLKQFFSRFILLDYCTISYSVSPEDNVSF